MKAEPADPVLTSSNSHLSQDRIYIVFWQVSEKPQNLVAKIPKKTFSSQKWLDEPSLHHSQIKPIHFLAVKVFLLVQKHHKVLFNQQRKLIGLVTLYRAGNQSDPEAILLFSWMCPNSDLKSLQSGCLPSYTSILTPSSLMRGENSICGATTLWIIPQLPALAADSFTMIMSDDVVCCEVFHTKYSPAYFYFIVSLQRRCKQLM